MLIKYKTPEHIDCEYLAAVYNDKPSEIIKVLKETDSIKIHNEWYTYCDNEFVPATNEGEVNVLNIYLDYVNMEDM